MDAAQQVAGITSKDLQRIEAECATNAGRAAVERRVEAAEKVMFEAMQPVDEQRVETVQPKMNKRLRKKKQRREEAVLVAVNTAATEAVDRAVFGAAAEFVIGADTVSVSESVLAVVLKQVLRDVVRVDTTAATVAVAEVPDEAGSRGVSVEDEADPQQTAYGVDHIAQESEMVAVASVGSRAADVVLNAAVVLPGMVNVEAVETTVAPVAQLQCTIPADRQQAYGVGHIAEKSEMVAVACVGSQTAAVAGNGDCDTGNWFSSYCSRYIDKIARDKVSMAAMVVAAVVSLVIARFVEFSFSMVCALFVAVVAAVRQVTVRQNGEITDIDGKQSAAACYAAVPATKQVTVCQNGEVTDEAAKAAQHGTPTTDGADGRQSTAACDAAVLVDTDAKQSAAACYAAVPTTTQVTVCQNGEVTDEAAKAAQHGTPTTDGPDGRQSTAACDAAVLVDTDAKQSAAACYAAVPTTKQVTVCQNGEVTDEAAKAAQHGIPTTDGADGRQSAAACHGGAAIPNANDFSVHQNGEVTDEAAKAAQHRTPTTDDAKVAEKLRKRLVRQKKRNNKAFKARSVQTVQKIMCA